jgi:hypothetical protein
MPTRITITTRPRTSKRSHGGRAMMMKLSLLMSFLTIASCHASAVPSLNNNNNNNKASHPAPRIHRQRSAQMEGLANSLASALAAGCSKALLAPFDTLKTIQQQSKGALSFQDACKVVMARPNGFLNFYVRMYGSVYVLQMHAFCDSCLQFFW